MLERFAAHQLVDLSENFPLFKVDTFKVSSSDSGLTFVLGLTFPNPTKLGLHIKGIDFGVALGGVNVARISVSEIQLKRGIQSMVMTTTMSFDHSTVDEKLVPVILAESLFLLLAHDEPALKLQLTGPIRIHGTVFAEEITPNFAVTLPVEDILRSLQLPRFKEIMKSSEHLKGIFESTKYSVDIKSDRIVIPLTLALPCLIPLPEDILIPFYTTMSIHGGEQHCLSFDFHPITIASNEKSTTISTEVIIYPENTLEAADALAAAINPLLASEPKVNFLFIILLSSIPLQIYFFPSTTNSTFIHSSIFFRF